MLPPSWKHAPWASLPLGPVSRNDRPVHKAKPGPPLCQFSRMVLGFPLFVFTLSGRVCFSIDSWRHILGPTNPFTRCNLRSNLRPRFKTQLSKNWRPSTSKNYKLSSRKGPICWEARLLEDSSLLRCLNSSMHRVRSPDYSHCSTPLFQEATSA